MYAVSECAGPSCVPRIHVSLSIMRESRHIKRKHLSALHVPCHLCLQQHHGNRSDDEGHLLGCFLLQYCRPSADTSTVVSQNTEWVEHVYARHFPSTFYRHQCTLCRAAQNLYHVLVISNTVGKLTSTKNKIQAKQDAEIWTFCPPPPFQLKQACRSVSFCLLNIRL